MQETRARIVEAAVDLHTTVGPDRTSISAIAERAGVQRHTVYAHFPDAASLFEACGGLWAERNPFPDAAAWSRIGDPRRRLATGLDELYAYWERTADDLAALAPALERMPELAGARREWAEAVEGATLALAAGWGARGRRRRRLLAAIGHALSFEIWRSLVQRGELDRGEAVALMTALVESAGAPGRDGATH